MNNINVTIFHTMKNNLFILLSISIFSGTFCNRQSEQVFSERVIAGLNIGEQKEITLSNGDRINLELLDIQPVRDSVRYAVRAAVIKVLVDGEEVTLQSGNYNLPVTAGRVQIDCPAIKDYYENADRDPWKLQHDARFRLWPKGSPWMEPGTFKYPIKQAWFASMTQMSNEPTYVDWGENPGQEKVYYHSGLDFGGAEGMDEIVSATDGIVISARNEKIKDKYDHVPAYVHPDAVNILDKKGRLVRYAHLDSIEPEIQLGAEVKMGQRIGYIGKQGSSGGWVHLHFAVSIEDSVTGEWMAEDYYPYAWEAYVNEYSPAIIAVARPHLLTWTGQEIHLDGSKSKSLAGDIVSYEWSFSNGTKAEGAKQTMLYDKPGEYSEILKVTDSKGNVDYDFTVVQVNLKDSDERHIPTIHASYYPTMGIKPGDSVSFFVRTFNSDVGMETWDFGDGSPTAAVTSETIERGKHTLGKYAEVRHSFSAPGHYIVKVERSNESGYKATVNMHLNVRNE